MATSAFGGVSEEESGSDEGIAGKVSGDRRVLTAERLRYFVAYMPETGGFVRLVATGQRGRYKPGSMKEHIKTNGYARVHVDGAMYAAHRLAWLYMHGRWPDGDIDHINGNRNDNRAANLREVTRAENMQNERKARSNNQCGLLGVSPHGSSWRAQITVNGVSKKLGSFSTPSEAHAVYLKAKRELHPFGTL